MAEELTAGELAAGVWGTLKEAIHAYAGVSPAIFFAVVAIAVFNCYVLSVCLAPPPPRYRERDFVEREPLPHPVQVGEIDEDELRQYDGSDPKKALLMAIKSQIYDVSQGRMFYEPGGPYAMFAGKDASRALTKMSFEEVDLNGDLSGLGPFELDALQDWEYMFMGKYSKVGTIKKPIIPVDGGSGDGNAAESTAAKVDDDGPSVPKGEQAAKVDDDGGPSVPKGEQAAKVDDDGPSIPKGQKVSKRMLSQNQSKQVV